MNLSDDLAKSLVNEGEPWAYTKEVPRRSHETLEVSPRSEKTEDLFLNRALFAPPTCPVKPTATGRSMARRSKSDLLLPKIKTPRDPVSTPVHLDSLRRLYKTLGRKAAVSRRTG